MAESCEDSSPRSTIETEDVEEIRITYYMNITEFISDEENNGDRTKDFLKLFDKGMHDPLSCSSVYKKDDEIKNMAEDVEEIRITDYMNITEFISNEENNGDRTKDFLKLFDKGMHDPLSCSAVYKKGDEIMNMAESWGHSGSRSNEEDLMTKDFLKLIDGISNLVEDDLEFLETGECGENSNDVSYEEDVRTKDYLKLIDRRRNEVEDQESTKMAKSGEKLGNEPNKKDTRTKDYMKLIDKLIASTEWSKSEQHRSSSLF